MALHSFGWTIKLRALHCARIDIQIRWILLATSRKVTHSSLRITMWNVLFSCRINEKFFLLVHYSCCKLILSHIINHLAKWGKYFILRHDSLSCFLAISSEYIFKKISVVCLYSSIKNILKGGKKNKITHCKIFSFNDSLPCYIFIVSISQLISAQQWGYYVSFLKEKK